LINKTIAKPDAGMASGSLRYAEDRTMPVTAPLNPRIDWVDYAKGICIILVVMMHCVLSIEDVAHRLTFMHAIVEFSKPFRMPDFFLLSGLFLANVINRDWKLFLDRKVVHFAYFYVLWLTVQASYKFTPLIMVDGPLTALTTYLTGFVVPFSTLWFIYVLPLFFVTCKLLKGVPGWIIILAAAALETGRLQSGWIVADEYAARFLYFVIGWQAAPYVFAFAEWVRNNLSLSVLFLVVWAIVNAFAVDYGIDVLPVVSILLGLAGTAALIGIGVLLSGSRLFDWLRYMGQHSIVIYLSAVIPMAIVRVFLLRMGLDAGLTALVATVVASGSPILVYWMIRNTPLKFFYERPKAFYLKGTHPDDLTGRDSDPKDNEAENLVRPTQGT
jgi:uncharacterized membrane protein YcfT